MSRADWPVLKEKLAAVIARKTCAQWCELMAGTDACFAPVLNLNDAPLHPHNVARNTFVEHNGVIQPAPAPRFSATPGAIQGPPPTRGEHNETALTDWGISPAAIDALASSGAL
jgi:alpha-methylacyl-CoA racemase